MKVNLTETRRKEPLAAGKIQIRDLRMSCKVLCQLNYGGGYPASAIQQASSTTTDFCHGKETNRNPDWEFRSSVLSPALAKRRHKPNTGVVCAFLACSSCTSGRLQQDGGMRLSCCACHFSWCVLTGRVQHDIQPRTKGWMRVSRQYLVCQCYRSGAGLVQTIRTLS